MSFSSLGSCAPMISCHPSATRIRLVATLGSCLAWLAFAGAARATPIPITDLFNTGVNASGNALATNATDLHWEIVSSPAQANVGGASNYYNGQAVVRSISRWTVFTPDTATAQWIVSPQSQQDPTVTSDPFVSGAAGNYIYQTKFTMPSEFYLPSITGNWACDNLQIKIILNSTEYPITTPTGWGTFTAFTLTSGFLSGENTLQFVVENDPGTLQPNPTGTYVSLSGVYVVPEPSMTALASIGIGSVWLRSLLRRRGRRHTDVG